MAPKQRNIRKKRALAEEEEDEQQQQPGPEQASEQQGDAGTSEAAAAPPVASIQDLKLLQKLRKRGQGISAAELAASRAADAAAEQEQQNELMEAYVKAQQGGGGAAGGLLSEEQQMERYVEAEVARRLGKSAGADGEGGAAAEARRRREAEEKALYAVPEELKVGAVGGGRGAVGRSGLLWRCGCWMWLLVCALCGAQGSMQDAARAAPRVVSSPTTHSPAPPPHQPILSCIHPPSPQRHPRPTTATQATLKNEVSLPGMNAAISEVAVSREAQLKRIEQAEAMKRALLERDAGAWCACCLAAFVRFVWGAVVCCALFPLFHGLLLVKQRALAGAHGRPFSPPSLLP